MGTKYTQRTDEEIIEALEKCHGLISPSARYLGFTRQALEYRLKTNPKLEEVRKACREEALDFAENRLIECVDKGSFPAIAFMLKTVGKSRGYTEEITVRNNNFNQNIDLSKLSMEELEKWNELSNKARVNNTESNTGGDL
jgi:hypothetical protein